MPRIGFKHSDETKAKLSAAKLGSKHTPEAKAKIGAALTGRAGELNHGWKGDDIGYSAVHYRAKQVLPNVCAHADGTCKGGLECAFKYDTSEEFVRVDHRGCYSARVEDYMRLCQSHHARYDGERDR